MVVVLMGVAGSGKTAVGERLAAALGWTFLDADALHPPANVEKMARGEPLTDQDRGPWLDALAERVARWLERGEDALLACSALREAYRARVAAAGPVHFVFLEASPAVLAERLRGRKGHFFPPALLESQLATLEPPRDALVVDADRPLDEVVAAVRRALGR